MEFISAKTILSGYAENNPWFDCNYNMNLYKGCCHGCIYCDSRSACYGVERFDEVRAKESALGTLARELRAKRRKGVVGMGAMSDPYNPFEKTLELTRGTLALLDRFGFGAALATKSDLVLRDTDVLQSIAAHSPTLVKITVTAADDALCRKVEPHAPLSSARFAAIEKLSSSGIFTGILLMPVLPFIEDTEENIAAIVRRAGESGARFIYPGFGVTLRQNQREWFFDRLDERFPGVKEKYLATFGNAYECHCPNHRALWTVFRDVCRQHGILYRMADIIAAYKKGYESEQLSLF